MVKVVWSRFQQCFVPLTVLLLERYSEMGLFRHLFNHGFRVRNSERHQVWGIHFFWNCLKFNVDFKNAKTSSEKNSCFWDNCIWIGCLKLSLLRKKRLLSAVNMSTNILKTLHVTKRDFFQLTCLRSNQ